MLSGISASMKHVKSLQEIYHFIFYYFYNIIVLGGDHKSQSITQIRV